MVVGHEDGSQQLEGGPHFLVQGIRKLWGIVSELKLP